MPDEKVNEDNQILLSGWSKQYGRPIPLVEVQEVNCNLSHFFSILLSWDKDFKQRGVLHEL